MSLGNYTKAIVGALVAGLGALQTAMLQVTVDDKVVEAAGVVTLNEWVTIGAAVVAALGLVWGVSNTGAQNAVGWGVAEMKTDKAPKGKAVGWGKAEGLMDDNYVDYEDPEAVPAEEEAAASEHTE